MVAARQRQAKTIPKGRQCLANLGLEKHNDSEPDVEQCTAEDEFEGGEIFSSGKPAQDSQGGDTAGHRSSPSSPNKLQNPIHQQEDKNNVRDVARLSESSQEFCVW